MDRDTLYRELKAQKVEMTPDERISAYLRGEEVDCIPYAFLAPGDALANIWGYTKGDVRRSFDIRCELIRRKKAEYGFTGLSVNMGLRGIGRALGSTIEYPENSVDYVKEHILSDYETLDRLEDFNVYESPFLLEKLEEAKKLMDCFPDMRVSTDVAGPLSTAAAIRRIEHILRDMRKNPEALHRLLDVSVNTSLKWVEAFCRETGSHSASFADPVTTTDILGEKYFEKFSKPYMKKLVDGITKITGKKPSAHICGHTKKIWTDLMEIGIENFSLDNCEDLEEAKKVMGEQVFLSGNVSPVEVLRYGTIDDVIENVKRCIQKGSDSPKGYMLMTGCQVPIGTPKENLDAYIYAARKYGANARLGKPCTAAWEQS